MIKCLHSPCGTVGTIEDHSQYWSLQTFKRHVADCHPEIGRYVRKFCPGCGTCKGDGVEVDRHIPICPKLGEAYAPMIYSTLEFPENTVTCEILTENFIFDSDILSSYKDRIKKSRKAKIRSTLIL